MYKLDGPGIWAQIKRKGLTMRAVAVQARISDGRLSEALRGRCTLIAAECLRLAEVLGLQSHELLVRVEGEGARGGRR